MIRLNTKQNSDWLAWVAFSHGSRGDLKPPMDTYHHASRREVNQNPVTKPGLKQGLVVMFWAPKTASEAISQHQIQKNFPGGACPQTTLASACTLTLPLVLIRRTNAMPSPLRSDYSSYAPDLACGNCTLVMTYTVFTTGSITWQLTTVQWSRS